MDIKQVLSTLRNLAPAALMLLALQACTPGDGSGGSDAGDQRDVPPVAAASVINFPISIDSGNTVVRAGTQVIVTSKDSDGVDDPILDFEWGVEMLSPSADIAFTQESNTAIAFMAPTSGIIADMVDIVVTLTVRDSDGVSNTTMLNVDVAPILDTNNYLVQNSNGIDFDEVFYLEISNSDDTSTHNFSLDITPTLNWVNLEGSPIAATGDPTAIPKDPFANIFSFPQLRGTVAAGGVYRLKLPIPLVDADEINALPGTIFQTRLELKNIQDAFITLLFDVQDISGTIPSLSISITDQSGNEIFTNADLASSINVNDIREMLGFESALSAQRYYDCIDVGLPSGGATLQGWLLDRGFPDFRQVAGGENFAHAIYVNNYDLGFGRDMYMRKAQNGDIYSYVVNHPNLESTIKGSGAFAVVAMEYSGSPDCTNPSAPLDANNKIVKFYAFAADATDGGFKRVNTINFDGRGERAIPGACTSCHGGDAGNIEFNTANAADLNATFMPWDLDSFLYTSASTEFPDPAYNASEIPPVATQRYTRAAQQEEFRKLNQMTLDTYMNEIAEGVAAGASAATAKRARFEAPATLINGWYNNAAPTGSCDFTLFEPETGCATITGEFNGEFIQEGWLQERALYEEVYARNCRMCHTQLAEPSLNFDMFAEFPADDRLESVVFRQGRMPLARLTADRFWLSYVDSNQTTTAAQALWDRIFPTSQLHVTGKSVANIVVDTVEAPAATVPNRDSTVLLSGLNSRFAENYSWQVSDPNSSLVTLDDSSAESTFFSPTIPGQYTVDLATSNEFGAGLAAQTTIDVIDRVPTLVDDNAVAPLPGNYNAGDNLVIDLGDLISSDGDGPATLAITANLPAGTAGVLEPGDLNIGRTVTFNPSSPAEDIDASFQFRVTDSDVSSPDSVTGTVTIQIMTSIVDNSAPTQPGSVSISGLSTTTANVSWSTSTDNVGVTRYVVNALQNGSIVRSQTVLGSPPATSTTITGLTPRTNYTFRVTAFDANSNASTPGTSAASPTQTSYISNVFPIIDAQRTAECTTCHFTGAGDNDFDLSGNSAAIYNELTGVGPDPSRVIPGSNNYIVTCVNSGCLTTMSDGNAIDYTAAETAIINDWANQGAQNN